MAEKESELVQWARISHMEAADRAVKSRDKYRFTTFCTEDVAVDVQLVADYLQLTKTQVLGRLVAQGAHELVEALGLAVQYSRPTDAELDEYQDAMDMADGSSRESARCKLRALGVAPPLEDDEVIP